MMNIQSIVRIYIGKVARRIREILSGTRGGANLSYAPFLNCYYYTGKKKQKRALISYRVLAVREHITRTWSSGGDVHDMIRVLSDLGYIVDVIDESDDTFVPTCIYDLFIGGTLSHFERYCDLLPESTSKIFYTAMAYWRYNNSQGAKRVQALKRRSGVLIDNERYVQKGSQEYALQNADGIILLSNINGKATFPSLSTPIHILEGATYIQKKTIDISKKNFHKARNNFLFFSGSGNVHKGLDIVLEAFMLMPDKQLYICSKLEKGFQDIYSKELFGTPNIHYIGDITVYGSAFYEIMYACGTLLYPSCSEGSPGAVMECIVQGVYPVVSRSSHISIEGIGQYFDSCDVDSIISVVKDISSQNERWFRDQAEAGMMAARDRFSPRKFRKNFAQHIGSIVSLKGNANTLK